MIAERFPQAAVRCRPSLGHVRLTLATPEDLVALRALVARAGADAPLEQLASDLDVHKYRL